MSENRKPILRFKNFSDAWEQCEFKTTFDFLQNNALSRADLSDEQSSAMNVHYGDILVKYGEVLDVSTEQIPYIVDDEIVKKYSSSELQNGDILIADAAEDETVGKCTEIANLQGVTVLAGLHTIPVRPRMKFSCGYLGYYMNSGSYHDQLLPLMQGTKVSSISKSAIQDTMILYPKSADEQQKIGGYFCNLDHLIALHRRKFEKLQSIKKSMLIKLFARKDNLYPEIRLKGFNAPWKHYKLFECLEVSNEKNLDNTYSKQDVLSVSGDYGIVNQIEFQGRSFAGASVTNYGVVYTGDIVYTKSPLKSNPYGIIKANKGRAGIVSTLYAIYHPKENVDPDFIQIYFEQNARMNNYIQPLVNKGAKNDMKVSAENALKGDVIFPGIDEQRKIVSQFNEIDSLISLHRRKYEKLQNVKKSMLERMFV